MVIIIVLGLTGFFLYTHYWDDFKATIFNDTPRTTIYIGSTAVDAEIADEYDERVRGLSRVKSMSESQGKLFIFDENDYHAIWMKDMLFPIDIIWIDQNLKVVDFEQAVDPDTYPTVFAPQTPARFVLEVNSHFIESLQVQLGDELTIPPNLIPDDIKQLLQNN